MYKVEGLHEFDRCPVGNSNPRFSFGKYRHTRRTAHQLNIGARIVLLDARTNALSHSHRDCAKEVAFTNFDAGVTEDAVGCRDMKIEVRPREVVEVVRRCEMSGCFHSDPRKTHRLDLPLSADFHVSLVIIAKASHQGELASWWEVESIRH